MKLSIAEWNRVVSALEIAEVVEKKKQVQANEIKPRNDVEAKRAYIAAENYSMLREKVQRETLG